MTSANGGSESTRHSRTCTSPGPRSPSRRSQPAPTSCHGTDTRPGQTVLRPVRARPGLAGFYEDRAVSDLLAYGSFPAARWVFELGCGTGRLAGRQLARHLADAGYLGADISDTMAALSRTRLRRSGRRAKVIRADGTKLLPVADAGSTGSWLSTCSTCSAPVIPGPWWPRPAGR